MRGSLVKVLYCVKICETDINEDRTSNNHCQFLTVNRRVYKDTSFISLTKTQYKGWINTLTGYEAYKYIFYRNIEAIQSVS